MTLNRKGEYDAVPTSESCSPTSEVWVEVDRVPSWRHPSWIIRSLLLTTLFFACLSGWLGVQVYKSIPTDTYETGFRTELSASREAIALSRVQFSGSPRFYDNGTSYFSDDVLKKPKYVGEASKAVDHSWATLHFGRFFIVTEAEARETWGDEYKNFWSDQHGGYVAEPEVLHSLHCLDHVRKSFYPDIYPFTHAHGDMHRDHCIDHIRQVVMCHGDLTPIPTRWYKGINQNYIDADRTYTCRDFQHSRDWVTARWRNSPGMAKNPTGDSMKLWNLPPPGE